MAVASSMIFFVQIAMAHWTHSLTLLAAAYHMLYNILSLIGCIATIKVGGEHIEALEQIIVIHFFFIDESEGFQHIKHIWMGIIQKQKKQKQTLMNKS